MGRRLGAARALLGRRPLERRFRQSSSIDRTRRRREGSFHLAAEEDDDDEQAPRARRTAEWRGVDLGLVVRSVDLHMAGSTGRTIAYVMGMVGAPSACMLPGSRNCRGGTLPPRS